MKSFMFLLLLVVATPSWAQTPISKETSNTYFSNCIKASHNQPQPQQLSQESQNMLCACTAARLTTNFTMEDMQTMTGQDPVAARLAYNKMLVDIYAPCMETPSYDYYYATCLQNPETQKYGNDVKSICKCLGGTMALHLRNNGSEVFRRLLQTNPNMTDPMAALTSDPEFKIFASQKLTSCLK
jgi:hypothetical protein